MLTIRSELRKNSMFRFVLYGLLRVITIGVCSIYLSNARADPVVCKSPGSQGALVDTQARCAFFIHFEPDDKKPDPRVVRSLQLKPNERARSIAVVVGIGNYKNKDYNVAAAHADVVKFESFLVENQHFDEVIVLEDDQASIENIRYFLRKYAIDRTNAFLGKVRFLFAYSGHGVQVPFLGDGKQQELEPALRGIGLIGDFARRRL